MNKATTNSFLSIFWRAISFNPPRKNFTARKLLGIVSFGGGVGGGEWGGGAGVIFGPRIFFWFRRETDKSVLIKLNGKKKMRLSAHSIIPITSRLEMEFFSHNQK